MNQTVVNNYKIELTKEDIKRVVKLLFLQQTLVVEDEAMCVSFFENGEYEIDYSNRTEVLIKSLRDGRNREIFRLCNNWIGGEVQHVATIHQGEFVDESNGLISQRINSIERLVQRKIAAIC